MRNPKYAIMTGKFSVYENGYVNDITLTGDVYIEAALEEKGRVALRRLLDTCSRLIYVSPFTGPDIRLRLYGDTKDVRIRVVTTCPVSLTVTNV